MDEYEMHSEENSQSERKKRGCCLGRILFLFMAVFVAVGTYSVCRGYELYERALATESVKDMYSRISSQEHYTVSSDIPDLYKQALVAVEDRRFYSHKGFDIRSFCRAIVVDIKTMSFAQGGSTITQQLAKNVYFTQEKTIYRKVAEVFMAFEIEKELSKDQILELYVNSIFYGEDYYCIYDASMGFFGKEPYYLDEYEITFLVGVPNKPSVYCKPENHLLAEERRIVVVNDLHEAGYITDEQYATLLTLTE